MYTSFFYSYSSFGQRKKVVADYYDKNSHKNVHCCHGVGVRQNNIYAVQCMHSISIKKKLPVSDTVMHYAV